MSKTLPPTVGNPATSSTSTTDTALETTSRSHSANSLSIPSKIQVKPANTVASHVPVKPSTSAKINTTDPTVGPKQTHSLGNNRSAIQEITSVLPTSKLTISTDTSDKGSSLRNNVPAKQDVPKATIESKETNTSEMDVSI